MKTTAIVEIWDDKTISVYVPEFEGFNLNGQGSTLEEAKKSLQGCIDDYISMFKEKGEEVPESLKNIEFEYKYDIASFFECFKYLSTSSLAKYAGINPSLMRQYKNRLAFASESQKSKIEEAIHRAGSDLCSVRF